MSRRQIHPLSLSVCGAALVIGCAVEPATSIVVVVDTSLGVPCEVDEVLIEAEGEAMTPVSRRMAISETNLPATLTLVPGTVGSVRVTTTGFLDGLPISVVTARSRFRTEKELVMQVVLTSGCSPASPCESDLTTLSEFSETPEPRVRNSCEGCSADGGCGLGVQAYEVTQSTLISFVDACSIPSLEATVLVSTDGQEAASPLDPAMPFPFHYFGHDVEALWIADNGYIGLSPGAPRATNARVGPLDQPQAPKMTIFPFWDAMATRSEGVCLAVQGSSPNRTLWITWKNTCFETVAGCGSSTERLNFSVGLEESSDRILFTYGEMVGEGGLSDRVRGLTSTIGLTGSTESACSTSECSQSGKCLDGSPCGYTQYSSQTVLGTLPALQFSPVEGP